MCFILFCYVLFCLVHAVIVVCIGPYTYTPHLRPVHPLRSPRSPASPLPTPQLSSAMALARQLAQYDYEQRRKQHQNTLRQQHIRNGQILHALEQNLAVIDAKARELRSKGIHDKELDILLTEARWKRDQARAAALAGPEHARALDDPSHADLQQRQRQRPLPLSGTTSTFISTPIQNPHYSPLTAPIQTWSHSQSHSSSHSSTTTASYSPLHQNPSLRLQPPLNLSLQL